MFWRKTNKIPLENSSLKKLEQVNFLKGLLPSAFFHLTTRKFRDFTDFQELFLLKCNLFLEDRMHNNLEHFFYMKIRLLHENGHRVAMNATFGA